MACKQPISFLKYRIFKSRNTLVSGSHDGIGLGDCLCMPCTRVAFPEACQHDSCSRRSPNPPEGPALDKACLARYCVAEAKPDWTVSGVQLALLVLH